MIVREYDETAWNAWVAERPASVQALCRRWPPDRLYRLLPVGQRVLIEAYNENGTVTVSVRGEYNFVMFERNVVGVDPNTLEECDLPDPGEILGVACQNDEQRDAVIREWREKLAREGN